MGPSEILSKNETLACDMPIHVALLLIIGLKIVNIDILSWCNDVFGNNVNFVNLATDATIYTNHDRSSSGQAPR
jgi:hypothetical protein